MPKSIKAGDGGEYSGESLTGVGRSLDEDECYLYQVGGVEASA